LKVVYDDHLGIDEDTGIIHVDDWDGTEKGRDQLVVLCGEEDNANYSLFEAKHLEDKIELCPTCVSEALKTGRCLVTTITAMKLKKDLNACG